jgi:hemolysin activation/secretion protein
VNILDKMGTKKFTAALLVALLLGGQSAVALAESPDQAGQWLNQERRRMEQEEIQRRIQEGKQQSSISGYKPTEGQNTETSIRFKLMGIETPPSTVFTAEELKSVKNKYIGHEVSLNDLNNIVNDFNKLYAKKGFLTCRAALGPQVLKGGVVKIDLIEGKAGDVQVKGNRNTRADYIRGRLHLKEGESPNIKQLDKDLQRFTATNDVQLHIGLQAGKEPGTTDYVITAYEPKNFMYGFFTDNLGNDSSGLYRGGVFWQDRSLTGRRDPLFLNFSYSKGMRGFSGSYTVPIAKDGTKFGASYSMSRTRNITGFLEMIQSTGYSRGLTLSLTHPLKTTNRVRTQAGVDYTYQNSTTNTIIRPWLDNTVNSLKFYVDQIYYGDSYVFYQKHAYQFGDYTDIYSARNHFDKYAFNTYYSKRYRSGQSLNVRVDGQFNGSNYIPSTEQFYIGGMYTVRGYSESLLNGYGGVSGSIEYEFPAPKNPNLRGYVFLDGGRIWGDGYSLISLGLVGTGIGVKARIGNNLNLNVCAGFPLTREVNLESQDKVRFNFILNGNF